MQSVRGKGELTALGFMQRSRKAPERNAPSNARAVGILEGGERRGMENEEEDVPQLNPETLAVLQAFLKENERAREEERKEEDGAYGMVKEDWRMSQFWYEPDTSKTIADELRRLSEGRSLPIACIACPSLYTQLKKSFPDLQVRLFEYDARFSKYGADFVFYDYNKPVDFPSELQHAFGVVVADPPYLSQECLEKTVETMKFLASTEGAEAAEPLMMVLTGAVQREHVQRLLKAQPCVYRPQHTNKLGNEFMVFTSYDPQEKLGGWEEQRIL